MASNESLQRKVKTHPSPISESSPAIALSQLTTSNTPTSGNLRIRRRKSNSKKSKKKQLSNECYSALLPILIITAVWCFCCWLMAWITLYQSFTDSTNNSGVLSNRKDILATKLREFLGDDNSAVGKEGKGTSILGQITNPRLLKKIQSILLDEIGYPQLSLSAYLEPPLRLESNQQNETNQSTLHMKLRALTPHNLTLASYPIQLPRGEDKSIHSIGACSQKGAQWIFPTFHPPSLDHHFEGNVFRKKPVFEQRWELALGIDGGGKTGHCPVDADPYLPWIHDSFPSNDGKYVEFIIGNKRRCNTDPKTFKVDLQNLEPQVALMQPIPVKRWKEGMTVDSSMQSLWQRENDNYHIPRKEKPILLDDGNFNPPRYLIATSLDDADEDGKYTRYICRFHSVVLATHKDNIEGESRLLKRAILGETLSNYPYNPEHANFRKRGSNPMVTPLEKGHDEQIWNNIHQIRCPVPEKINESEKDSLIGAIASGRTVLDGVPSIYVDLIPIRTPARIDKEGYGIPGVKSSPFKPNEEWGDSHVLPLVEASGRWSNIPVCYPPKVDESTYNERINPQAETSGRDADVPPELVTKNKSHFLVGCVWASHSFSTRGNSLSTDSSTSDRLLEFLTYHLRIAGFDHVYVYDNSDTTESSKNTLKSVTDMFSPEQVTRIPWPHRVCNNNRPAHSNPGVRSSQYAAEASCRARYGSDTTWMATLDVDEYLILVGDEYTSLRHWLEHITETEQSTKILSFFQTRALPNIDTMVPYDGNPTGVCNGEINDGDSASSLLARHKWGKKLNRLNGTDVLKSTCVMKDPNKTYMETYNCEPTVHPKPDSYAWRAKKQIYRPDFVLNHFVHYSLVTRLILDKPLKESPRFAERRPYERRVNELTEGYLLHSKTTVPDSTSQWYNECPQKGDTTSKKDKCAVGIPAAEVLGEKSLREKGNIQMSSVSSLFESNCFRHSRVLNEWVPKLELALRNIS